MQLGTKTLKAGICPADVTAATVSGQIEKPHQAASPSTLVSKMMDME